MDIEHLTYRHKVPIIIAGVTLIIRSKYDVSYCAIELGNLGKYKQFNRINLDCIDNYIKEKVNGNSRTAIFVRSA